MFSGRRNRNRRDAHGWTETTELRAIPLPQPRSQPLPEPQPLPPQQLPTTTAEQPSTTTNNYIQSSLVRTLEFRLHITAKMAPKANLVVYYVREDGETVADHLEIDVEKCVENKVCQSFNLTHTN